MLQTFPSQLPLKPSAKCSPAPAPVPGLAQLWSSATAAAAGSDGGCPWHVHRHVRHPSRCRRYTRPSDPTTNSCAPSKHGPGAPTRATSRWGVPCSTHSHPSCGLKWYSTRPPCSDTMKRDPTRDCADGRTAVPGDRERTRRAMAVLPLEFPKCNLHEFKTARLDRFFLLNHLRQALNPSLVDCELNLVQVLLIQDIKLKGVLISTQSFSPSIPEVDGCLRVQMSICKLPTLTTADDPWLQGNGEQANEAFARSFAR
ncbi:hypothetical protein EJB05_32377, partial [Eragrostis curvula]